MKRLLVAFAIVAVVLLFSRGIARPKSVHAIPADNGRYVIYPLSAPVGGVLLDTQTGKVWQITTVSDQKGNETGKIALVPADFLYPSPGGVQHPH